MPPTVLLPLTVAGLINSSVSVALLLAGLVSVLSAGAVMVATLIKLPLAVPLIAQMAV